MRMQPTGRVNQKTIAEKLGLNQSTVSCILTGRNIDRYHPETQRKVLDMARSMGYRPSRKARLLRGASSRMIGILDFGSGRSIERRCLRRICAAVIQRGYTPLPLDVHWFTFSADAACEVLLDQEVEGVILLGSSDTFQLSNLDQLTRTGLPVVACLGIKPPGISQVDVERETVFHQMTSLLLNAGRQRPAFLGRPSTTLREIANSPSEQALRGFQAAAREAGIRRPSALLERLPDAGPANDALLGRLLMLKLLQRSPVPDAVICYNDLLAAGAMAVCQEQGLQVPGDVAFIGFGDEDISPHLRPALSSMRIHEEMLTAEVMETLFQALATPAAQRAKDRQILLRNASHVVLRDSCGIHGSHPTEAAIA